MRPSLDRRKFVAMGLTVCLPGGWCCEGHAGDGDDIGRQFDVAFDYLEHHLRKSSREILSLQQTVARIYKHLCCATTGWIVGK